MTSASGTTPFSPFTYVEETGSNAIEFHIVGGNTRLKHLIKLLICLSTIPLTFRSYSIIDIVLTPNDLLITQEKPKYCRSCFHRLRRCLQSQEPSSTCQARYSAALEASLVLVSSPPSRD